MVWVRAEEGEVRGPVWVITMRFRVPVSVPLLETTRLDLFQEPLLAALHLVSMLSGGTQKGWTVVREETIFF